MFAALGVFFSFAVLFTYATKYSIAELWLLWLGTLVFVRYGLQYAFHKLAVHRGVWHSILAAAFSAVLTALAFYYIFGREEGVAWLAAGFMFIGYLVHLALDEIYSVDVMDVRVKSSFGTALKPFDWRHPGASAAMAAAMAVAIWFAPSTHTFVDGLSSRDLWAGLNQRMLPQEKWFGVVAVNNSKVSTEQPVPSPVTTGSLPETAPAAPAP